MADEEMKEMATFAYVLLERTKRGEIEWAVTDDEGTFIYSSAKSSMVLYGMPYEEEDDPYAGEYSLSLMNHQGQTVSQLENEVETVGEVDISRLLAELYTAARERALEVSDTFNDMRRSLGLEDSTGSRDAVSELW